MIISATGHRTGPRVGGYSPLVTHRMETIAEHALALLAPERVLSGMALGWDQAVAGAASRLGIPWVACVPFTGQESRWPAHAQMTYRALLADAAETVVVSSLDIGVGMAMRMRNQYLISNCDTVLALWDGGGGGTSNALDLARPYGARRTTINLWSVFIDGSVNSA